MADHHIREAIDHEAAAWAARLSSGDFSDADRRRLDAWLASEAGHREAFNVYADVLEKTDAAGDAFLLRDLEEFADSQPVKRGWLVAVPALAASIAAGVFAVIVLAQPRYEIETYATDRGGSKQVTLADGSSVMLNTDTQIAVRYEKKKRSVAISRGEALFSVTPNPGRPFVVESDNATAVVVGTEFNVYAGARDTVISVLSGVVEVDASASEAQTTLSAGQEATVSSGDGALSVRVFNPDAVIAWRRGAAYYENKPLGEVVTDLNRYFAGQIIIGDESLRNIPVTGGFDLTDQDAIVDALAAALSLRAVRSGSNIVLMEDEG